MDMQNVSNLTIPEGRVRTIQDKNGMLLWGELAYNTRYIGDTNQNGTPTPDSPIAISVVTGLQTVNISGKNFVNLNVSGINTRNSTYAVEGNTLVCTTNADAQTARVDLPVYYPANKDLTISYDYEVLANGTTLTNAIVYLRGSSGGGIGETQVSLVVGKKGHRSATVIGGTSDTSKKLWFYLKNATQPGIISVKFSNIQIEESSSETSFQPYNGESCIVDLDSTELCKIGNYQDYIYKSGGDWYVHKETGVTTDTVGSTDITIAGMVSNGGIYSYCGGTVSGTTVTYTSALVVANTIYYQLATTTDTQITDATLISQLDAIYQWLTRYGYNATVSGNLPLIISKTIL